MKMYNRVFIFLKQDIFKLSTLVFVFLALVSGGSIIFSREFFNAEFRIDNIYAMYATISEFLLMFVAVNLFGKEFRHGTINMIRVSKRSYGEILVRKLLIMVVLSILVAACAFIEVELYAIIFSHDINSWEIARNLLIAYCIYGVFLFALATPIVMMLKNTLSSFITVLVIVSFSPMIMNILSGNSITKKMTSFIPFSFIRNTFSFAGFNLKQIIITLVWSGILLVISRKLFEDRGYA